MGVAYELRQDDAGKSQEVPLVMRVLARLSGRRRPGR